MTKGILLCGGNGTRLRPATLVVNKHVLNVWNLPMIYYPLRTLINAGIKEIMVITGKEHAGSVMNLLGNGNQFGVELTYRVQYEAGGIAEALGLCESFAGSDNVVVILGDNIFEINPIKNISELNEQGAKVFVKSVPDPCRFGVATVEGNKITKIVEKPKKPESKLAVTGLYIYDSQVWDVIKELKPSGRGELEITDVNNWYIKEGVMIYETVKGWWIDAGTPESMYRASTLLKKKEEK